MSTCIIASMPQPGMVVVEWHAATFIGASSNASWLMPPGYRLTPGHDQFRSTIHTPDGRKVDFGHEPVSIDCPSQPAQCDGKCEPTS